MIWGISFENNKIKFNGEYGATYINFEIFDLNGRLIASQHNKINNFEFDTSLIAHGIYVLRINVNNNQIIKKMAL